MYLILIHLEITLRAERFFLVKEHDFYSNYFKFKQWHGGCRSLVAALSEG
jgi:hypothetical protein